MLTDRVIIITGASSGIGAATAIEAARHGMDCVITARREEKLQQVAARVRAVGRRCEFLAADVAAQDTSARLLEIAQRAFGRFDAVFANAGYGMDHAMHSISDRDLRAMFEVNFFAGVDLLQKAARALLDAKREGHLLMCSSCLAKFTLPGSGAYCCTKAAQNHFCRAMRLELRAQRPPIHVASVHPVGTATEFFEASARRSGAKPDRPPRMFMQPPERVARAVIACLKRPRPEVWTSFSVRAMAGVMTVLPRLGDVLMRASGRVLSREDAGAARDRM